MWIKTQDGKRVNLKHIVSIEILDYKITAVTDTRLYTLGEYPYEKCLSEMERIDNSIACNRVFHKMSI